MRARRLGLAASLAAAAFWPAAALADEGAGAQQDQETTVGQAAAPAAAPVPVVYGSMRTYIRLYEDISPADRAAKRFRIPILNILHAGAARLADGGLSIEVMGYGELDAIEPLTGPRGRGDLLLAAVTWRGLPDDLLELRVGRQLVHAGVAQNAILDGGSLRLRLPLSLEIEGWGGFVAEPGFAADAGSWQAGGRLAWNPADHGHVGVSFAREHAGGDLARQVLGLDFAWRTFEFLSLAGQVTLDLVDLGLGEVDLWAEGHITRELRIDAQYRRFDPTARIPKTSIFSIFANSAYDEVSASLGYHPLSWGPSLDATAGAVIYDDLTARPRGGLRARWVFDRETGDMVGVQLSRVGSPTNGLWSTRAYGAWLALDRLFLTGDVEVAVFDEAIRRRDWSAMGRLNASVDLSPGWRLMAEAGLTVDATFDQAWVGMLRLTYDLSGRSARRRVAL